jgi:hypothetical protein
MRRVLAAFAVSTVFALVGGAILAAPALAAPIQISNDPYTNPSSQHKTQVEPDTYAFGSTIVAAFQSGRFFDGGASNVGFSTSKNGGSTWTPGFLPGTTVNATPAGPYDRDTDPSVAYDAKHNVWMVNTLALKVSQGVNDVIVSRSTDGGLTFGNPVIVAAGSPVSFYDKNWQTCDNTPSSPFYGHCYSEWDDNGSGNLMLMSTSTDGGLTWGPPKSTPNFERGGIGGQPVVLASGKVVVPFLGGTGIKAFNSTDGGVTWSTPITVSGVSYHFPAGGIRAPGPLPSAEVKSPGPVVVVWPDCRFESGCSANDIVFSFSADGVSWSAPKRIPIDAVGSGVDHFIPSVALRPQGTTVDTSIHIAVGYYYYPVSNCTFATCQLNVGFVFSANGGSTWSAPQQLAGPMQLGWLANTNQGRMVGDYISTSYSLGNAYTVYASATAPVNNVFQEAMFTTGVAAQSLRGPGRPASSAGAHRFRPWNDSRVPRTLN